MRVIALYHRSADRLERTGTASRARRRSAPARAARRARRRPATTPSSARTGESPPGDPTELALLEAAARDGARRPGRPPRAARAGAVPLRPRAAADVGVRRARTAGCRARQGRARGGRSRAATRSSTPTAPSAARRPGDRHRGARSRRSYAKEGLRVLAVARDGSIPTGRRRNGARRPSAAWPSSGSSAMFDPPREEVAAAVARCRAAGIRIIVITGDAGLTAAEIARRVGIADDPVVITGAELDALGSPSSTGCCVKSRELDLRAQLAGGEAPHRGRAARRGPRRRDDGRRRQRRAGPAPRRHRHRDGTVGHGRRARGVHDGAHRRRLLVDRDGCRGRTPRLRQRPEVHRLHLRPRAARGRAVRWSSRRPAASSRCRSPCSRSSRSTSGRRRCPRSPSAGSPPSPG